MDERVGNAIEKVKNAAKSGYERGNGIMDRFSFLKSKRSKLVAWGVLAVVVLAVLRGVFSGGGSSGESSGGGEFENSPIGACERFVAALRTGNVQEFVDASMMYATPLNPVGLDKMPEENRGEFKELIKKFSSFKVTEFDRELDRDIAGNISTTVTLTKDGEDVKFPLYVCEVDGVWKVDFQAFIERRGL